MSEHERCVVLGGPKGEGGTGVLYFRPLVRKCVSTQPETLELDDGKKLNIVSLRFEVRCSQIFVLLPRKGGRGKGKNVEWTYH